MVDCHWHAYSIAPHKVFVDAIIFKWGPVWKLLDGESFLKHEETYAFHQEDSINLVIEESLLSPHRSDQELLVFEKKREDTVEDVNGPLNLLDLVFIGEHLLLGGCLVHDFD
jgi:hypothetical protein